MKLATAVYSKGCGLVVRTLGKKEAQSSAESVQQRGGGGISRSLDGELFKTPALLPFSVALLSLRT